MLLGGDGVISVTANVAPRLMHEMCEAALAGRRRGRARDQQQAARLAPPSLLRSEPDPGQMGGAAARAHRRRHPPAAHAARGSFHNQVREAMRQAGRSPESGRTEDSMRRSMRYASHACFACAALRCACGCSFELPTKKVEYKSAGKLPPLEVPPDLTRPAATIASSCPMSGARARRRSRPIRRSAKDVREAAGSGAVLPTQDNARVERAGTQRWLVVKGEPEQALAGREGFLAGDRFHREPRNARSRRDGDRLGGKPRADPGRLHPQHARAGSSIRSIRPPSATSSARGSSAASQPGTTEIYISHRGMEEVYTSVAAGPDQVAAAAAESRARSRDAAAADGALRRAGRAREDPASRRASAPQRATLQKRRGGRSSALNEQFDRAWRRVGLALDRVGFTVEDRDRSKGLYFVRYIDPEIDNKSADRQRLALALQVLGQQRPEEERSSIACS